jgi:hypothetical protein
MLDSEDAAAGGGADMMTKGRLVFTCQTLKEKMGEELLLLQSYLIVKDKKSGKDVVPLDR